MNFRLLPALMGILMAGGNLAGQVVGEESQPPLVVHEWGVLRVGQAHGVPVLGSTDNRLNSVPKFVYRNDELAPPKFEANPELLIIDKPVIHFYGAEGQQVKVTVSVSKGMPVVYYPKPELTRETFTTVNGNAGFGTYSRVQSMTWNCTLSKAAPGNLPAPPDGHWWEAVRRIPSDYVSVDGGGEAERFLFYEATSTERPSVVAEVGKGTVILRNTHEAESAPVVLIINDNGNRLGIYQGPIAPGGQAVFSKDDFQPWSEESLMENCRKQWIACGMTPEEAEGIVESWHPELLESQGFTLISKIPDEVYEQIFPISIDAGSTPVKLTRACLVFDSLAGQDSRVHWLPELQKECRSAVGELGVASFKERLRARARLVALGEVASPLLKEARESPSSDTHTKMALGALLGELAESPVCARLVPDPVNMGGWGGIRPVRPGFVFPGGEEIIPVVPGVVDLPILPEGGAGKAVPPIPGVPLFEVEVGDD